MLDSQEQIRQQIRSKQNKLNSLNQNAKNLASEISNLQESLYCQFGEHVKWELKADSKTETVYVSCTVCKKDIIDEEELVLLLAKLKQMSLIPF